MQPQLALSVSSADSKSSNVTSVEASSSTPSPNNGTLTLVVKKGSSPLSVDVKLTKGGPGSEEEDCVEEPEPEPEGAAKKNGKELTLGNPNDKYTLGNATAEPEPEGTGHNGTTGSGTNDKLTEITLLLKHLQLERLFCCCHIKCRSWKRPSRPLETDFLWLFFYVTFVLFFR
ncbi:hypothetical protein Ocin01_14882 [Orchesella cincta]|uniref:Uncharacterized protein n=1 Tax=Orchesella cincta TaxID=48709 RepID=A0A1D2MFP7_ORCCI|nr:hypothetical protein Ocin01_14882 [Orchesella cincta]